jgi:hypothetical protein
MRHSRIVVAFALILSVALAPASRGVMIEIGDMFADDGRCGLHIYYADEFDDEGMYWSSRGFQMPSPLSVLVMSRGGVFVSGDDVYLARNDGGDDTASRQVRITGYRPGPDGSRNGFAQWYVENGANIYLDGKITISDGGNFFTDGSVFFGQGSKLYIHLSPSYYVGDVQNSQPVEVTGSGDLHLNADLYPTENAHALNLCAGMFLPSGVYTPVLTNNYLDRGVAAFGGTWYSGMQEFEVCDISYFDAGEMVFLMPGSRYVFTPIPSVNEPEGPMEEEPKLPDPPPDPPHLDPVEPDLPPPLIVDPPDPDPTRDNKDWLTTKALGVSTGDDLGGRVSIAATPGGWSTSDDLARMAAALQAQRRPADLLAVWDTYVQNTGEIDELYYSMDLGEGQEHLTLFMYMDGQWFEFSADILEWGSMAYDEDGVFGFVAPAHMMMFAVFGVNAESSLSNVPEPATLTLLSLGAIGLLRRRT